MRSSVSNTDRVSHETHEVRDVRGLEKSKVTPAVSKVFSLSRKRTSSSQKKGHRAAPNVVEDNPLHPLLHIRHEFKGFKNWAKTVRSQPAVKFYPQSAEEIAKIVQYAAIQGVGIRCVGFGHTWDKQFADDGQILISNLPFGFVKAHSVKRAIQGPHPVRDEHSELGKIELLGTVTEADSQTGDMVERGLVKLGSQVTNEHIRLWSMSDEGGDYALACNVIMRDITIVGAIMNMCHGAGLSTQTVSDSVRAIEFINAKGERQVVNDSEQIKVVAGSFGLFGPVISVTMVFNKMSYAKMQPVWRSVVETVPPPEPDKLPPKYLKQWEKQFGVMKGKPNRSVLQRMTGQAHHESDKVIDEEALRAALETFERDMQKRYAEIFSFAGGESTWSNCWDDDGFAEDAEEYPSKRSAARQQAAGVAGRMAIKVVEPVLGSCIFSAIRTRLIEKTSALPSQKTITTQVSNAIHFRTGIHNMKVRCMEVLLRIPRNADGSFDFNFVRKCFWDAIILSESKKHQKPYAMNLTLEARIMGGSDMLLAPEFGNGATLSIEVLSTEPGLHKRKEAFNKAWFAFTSELYDIWSSYKDENGDRIEALPHFAKEWRHLSMQSETGARTPLVEYLREGPYKSRIAQFHAVAEQVARAGGYTLEEMKGCFCNEGLGAFFYQDYPASSVRHQSVKKR